ncbi:expressed unknown protein [Seminavis robusta]|uniref:Uncharacterized protein n=1 Tax=Seminavis robusta TaxID=568900 RepID=A0A9N8EYQ6_9STRA|nr:expressed unknown protein [Seminavis robusta]|eukprot:Sro2323_g323290.1 n/a (439) ;mRNA; r:6697-8013
MAVNAIQEDESMSLRAIVRKIRTKLQKAKRRAWTMNPALQLVQIFCTDIDINKRGFSVAHNLVGHHFGHLDQRLSGDGRGGVGAKAYTTTAASAFGSTLAVAPVSAKYEPLLYLALVAWEEAMLKRNHEVTNMFPLVDERGQALTVREAFVRCSNVFTPRANIANLDAQKMNGDILEVLVHASVTLASMKMGSGDKDYLPGVPLLEFLPLVRRLMLPGHLRELPKKGDFFDSIKFDWPLVPGLGGSDSSLPVEIAAGTGSVLGFLSRPEDQAKVDGYISNMLPSGKTTQEPFICIECKNYADGVTASVLNQVFKRIKSGVQCSMIFVSKLKGKVFLGSSLAKVKQDCFAAEHDMDCVTVLCWGSGADDEPGFLKIGEDFKAKTEKTTKLLVVIFQVECVTLGSAHELDVSRKRKCPPCANFPLKSSQESSQESVSSQE